MRSLLLSLMVLVLLRVQFFVRASPPLALGSTQDLDQNITFSPSSSRNSSILREPSFDLIALIIERIRAYDNFRYNDTKLVYMRFSTINEQESPNVDDFQLLDFYFKWYPAPLRFSSIRVQIRHDPRDPNPHNFMWMMRPRPGNWVKFDDWEFNYDDVRKAGMTLQAAFYLFEQHGFTVDTADLDLRYKKVRKERQGGERAKWVTDIFYEIDETLLVGTHTKEVIINPELSLPSPGVITSRLARRQLTS